MSGRGPVPTAQRAMIGVLLVGVLVAACGSNAPHAAPTQSTPGSTSAAASISAAASTWASISAPASTSTPVSNGSASATPLTSPTAATGTTTDGPSAVASPVGLGPGQVGTRSQVPWNQIGPGWFLVQSDTSTNLFPRAASAPPPAKGGTATLSVVSPDGARYMIATWPGNGAGSDPENLARLAAWSGSGREALFVNPGGVIVEMDLTTGVRHEISVPGLSTAGFTSPTGANLVAAVDSSTTDGTWVGESLVRLDLNGKQQVQLAALQPTSVQWLYSPDGATVYLNGLGGLRAVSNGGGAVREVATFASSGARCVPVSWWGPHTILASCDDLSGSRLWLVPSAGGSATPLTAAPGKDPVGIGYDNAVRAGDAVFAEHLEGCGVVTVHRLAPSGVGTRVVIPQSLSNDHLIGAVGTKIAIASSTECGAPSWFGFYDPATNTTQKIVPDVPGELGVLSAVPFP